jgi:hypothetical protein
VQVWTGSIFDLDAFQIGWQNLAAGVPGFIGLAGRNLIGLSPPPQAGTAALLDVAGNMAIPVNDAAYMQVPMDVISVILDYAQHLASFKMGGDEFASTEQLRSNLVIEAANYNQRIRQLNFYNDVMRGQPLIQQAEVPRLQNPTVAAMQALQGAQQ